MIYIYIYILDIYRPYSHGSKPQYPGEIPLKNRGRWMFISDGFNSSEKYELVSWDYDVPDRCKNKINVPNHQPVCIIYIYIYTYIYIHTYIYIYYSYIIYIFAYIGHILAINLEPSIIHAGLLAPRRHRPRW